MSAVKNIVFALLLTNLCSQYCICADHSNGKQNVRIIRRDPKKGITSEAIDIFTTKKGLQLLLPVNTSMKHLTEAFLSEMAEYIQNPPPKRSGIIKLNEMEILYNSLISGNPGLEALLAGLKEIAKNPEKIKNEEIDYYFQVMERVLNGIGQIETHKRRFIK